jgi:hypothetical protein
VKSVLNVSVAMVLTAFAPASAMSAAGPSATVVGTVTLTAADGSAPPGDGARVVLACGTDSMTRTEVADDHGAFRFLNVPVDRCSIEADVQGFVAQPVTVVTVDQEVVVVDIHLGIAPLRVGVNVGGTAPVPGPTMLPGSCRSDASRRLERSAQKCRR